MSDTFSMRVVGAGPVAEALVAMTPPLGWDVTVSADEATPTGFVLVVVGAQQFAVLPLVNGHASLVGGPFARAGREPIAVVYGGDKVTRPAVGAGSVTVTD